MSRPIKALECIGRELSLVENEITYQLNIICDEYKSHNIHARFMEEAVHHSFSQQGKYLRPGLLILSAYAVRESKAELKDCPITALIKIAAGVELIHSASLVHDDIIDRTDYRRNHYSLQKQFGNSTAVLIGDILYSQFFSILTELEGITPAGQQQIFRLFCHTTKQMCFGEIWEHRFLESNTVPDFDAYVKILESKTALLMAAACSCGAIFYEADEKQKTTLENFGRDFGIAYQLTDDYIDSDSLLKDNRGILKKALSYTDKAEKDLMEGFTEYTNNHYNRWLASLRELCVFIREESNAPGTPKATIRG